MPIRQSYPGDYASHMPILIGIASKTRIRRILEFGSGEFSTNLFLNLEAFPDLVELISVESANHWIRRFNTVDDVRFIITAEEPPDLSRFDLIFVDSPSTEERKATLRQLAAQPQLTGFIVLHDSENPAYEPEFALFPHHFDISAYEPATTVIWHEHGNTEATQVMLRDIKSVIGKFADCPPYDVPAWLTRFSNPSTQRLTVSVAMVAFHRHLQLRNTLETFLWQTRKPDQIVIVEDGYDGGATESVCREFAERLPVQYVCRRNRPNVVFSNAAIPRNIGIRQSTGDVLIVQNAEVRFTKPTDLANVITPTESDPTVSTCAPCEALDSSGRHQQWYCNPEFPNYNHFCQAFRRDQLIALGGFDEAFRGYGYEDDEFRYRFNRIGTRAIYARDVLTQHQWHEQHANPHNADDEAFNIDYAKKCVEDIKAGLRTVEANVGWSWGDVNS